VKSGATMKPSYKGKTRTLRPAAGTAATPPRPECRQISRSSAWKRCMQSTCGICVTAWRWPDAVDCMRPVHAELRANLPAFRSRWSSGGPCCWPKSSRLSLVGRLHRGARFHQRAAQRTCRTGLCAASYRVRYFIKRYLGNAHARIECDGNVPEIR